MPSTQKPPHRLSRRGSREPVSPHRQSPSGALVRQSQVWNHDAGVNPLGAAGEEDGATTSVPTGRNWDVTDAQSLNFDRLGHLSQLNRTAPGSL